MIRASLLALAMAGAPAPTAPAPKPPAPKRLPPAPPVMKVVPRTLAAQPAGPAAVITLKANAEVKDRVIRLADIANIEAVDPVISQSLEAVEVGVSPVFGGTRQVSAQFVQIRVKQLGIDPKSLLFQGPLLTTVTRPEQILSGSELAAVTAKTVEEQNPGVTAQVTFTPGDLRLPTGNVEIKPQGARIFNNTSGSMLLLIHVDGHQEASVTVSFRLLRKAPAVVAVRDLLPGSVVGEDDVKLEERFVQPGPLVLSDLSLAVGQQVATPIKGGTALTSSVLKPALVIRRGTRVKLICKGAAFTITTAGEALQDAVTGQTVRVRNATSLLEVTGVARGPQTVEIPF